MIRLPVLCNRESVMGAIDFQSRYRLAQVDRACVSATDSVHRLCNRLFYPTDDTRFFDWPNYQSTYPWKIYLDANELAAPATSVKTGAFQPVPTDITADVLYEPINYGPPYSWIEIRRDLPGVFGANTTPQRDTEIIGTYGYWTKTLPAGSLAAAISSTSATTVQVTDSSTETGVSVGDMLLIDSERMIVSDKQPIAAADVLTGAGCTTASKLDNILAVGNGANYQPGETLLIDQEALLILFIEGNNLFVVRAWAASDLATHQDNAQIYAYRLLTVMRGQLGTAGATHSNGTTIARYEIPGGVNELAIAEAVRTINNATGGWNSKTPTVDTMYQQETGGFGTRTISGKSSPLDGINDLRMQVKREFGRQARQRTS